MRIRKRYQSLLPPSDLSSQLPPSTTAAAAAASAVATAEGATGGKEVEPRAASASAAAAAGHVLEGGCGGGGGRGLHLKGRTTAPTPCLPFRPPPSAPATARGAERGDLPPPAPPLPTRGVLFVHGHGREVPRRAQDGAGGTHREWNSATYGCGGNASIPKSLDAEASESRPVGHGGQKMLPSDAAAALAAAGAMARWRRDEEGEFPAPKKRKGAYHPRGRSQEEEEEEEENNLVAEGERKPAGPSNTRRRLSAAYATTAMAAAGTALTSAGAPKKCDDTMVKEEGADATADGNNRGVGKGKKRRSPAVLMEGSRCSRVNGRGWRCCQQTLVGYSLCEHHLGKGRLRSVSSVKCNVRGRKKENVDDDDDDDYDDGVAPPLPSLPRQQLDQPSSGDGHGEDEEEEKPSKRRRNRIGIVKARSISSLLQHPTPTTIAAPAPFPSPSTPIPATVLQVQVTAAAPTC